MTQSKPQGLSAEQKKITVSVGRPPGQCFAAHHHAMPCSCIRSPVNRQWVSLDPFSSCPWSAQTPSYQCSRLLPSSAYTQPRVSSASTPGFQILPVPNDLANAGQDGQYPSAKRCASHEPVGETQFFPSISAAFMLQLPATSVAWLQQHRRYSHF